MFSQIELFSQHKASNDFLLDDTNLLGKGSFYGGEYTSGSIPEGAVLIENSFYFTHLNGSYGYNYGVECGVVAGQILLGYYDTFQNDNIVEDEYEFNFANSSNAENIQQWYRSPGTGSRSDSTTGNAFKDYLESFVSGSIENGMSNTQVAGMVKSYLNSRNISYSTRENWFLDVPVYAEDIIDSGNPVILGGGGHFCVAFGYSDDCFIVCDGNGTYGYVLKTLYNPDLTYALSIGSFGLTINDHVHSDNYYSSYHDAYYCPCGQKFKKLSIHPNDWGFEQQYYFYNKSKEHTINGYTFDSERLRTGFIENSTINLSPRRENAGYSRFDIIFPNNILKFNVEMAWWSDNEYIDDAATFLYCKDIYNANSWYQLCDIKMIYQRHIYH